MYVLIIYSTHFVNIYTGVRNSLAKYATSSDSFN